MAAESPETGAVETADREYGAWCEQFGELHGLTPEERHALKLLALHGYQDEEIGATMRISPPRLGKLWAGMFGKTRTHSQRELQSMLLRFVMDTA